MDRMLGVKGFEPRGLLMRSAARVTFAQMVGFLCHIMVATTVVDIMIVLVASTIGEVSENFCRSESLLNSYFP